MARVVADITMSLDGYVTAVDPGPGKGLGVGGEVLHRWALEGSERDRRVLDEATAATGAVVMGRNTFDVIDAPDGWRDDMGYGAERDQTGAPPCFVVTNARPERIRLDGLITVVTTGLPAALQEAASAAGEMDVVIMGGGALIASALTDGLVDVLVLHVAPVILGDGTPLFRGQEQGAPLEGGSLRLIEAVTTDAAVHLRYDVLAP